MSADASTITTGIASEAGHFYDRSGNPAYSLMGKNGKMRPVHLGDARTLNLVPSVTSVIKCAAAPGLDVWKQKQVLMSALTLGRGTTEPDDEFIARIMRDSQEQARKAAERGTEIHAAVERHYDGQGDPEWATLIGAVTDAVDDEFGAYRVWGAELSFAHSLGFGGKTDLVTVDGADVLIDFKTKEAKDFEDGKKLAYFENAMQLAAYREGLRRPDATCANVFISRTEPWTVSIHVWPEDDLQRAWRAFKALLEYWKAERNLETGWFEWDGNDSTF